MVHMDAISISKGFTKRNSRATCIVIARIVIVHAPFGGGARINRSRRGPMEEEMHINRSGPCSDPPPHAAAAHTVVLEAGHAARAPGCGRSHLSAAMVASSGTSTSPR
jgi:hypothetical protein